MKQKIYKYFSLWKERAKGLKNNFLRGVAYLIKNIYTMMKSISDFFMEIWHEQNKYFKIFLGLFIFSIISPSVVANFISSNFIDVFTPELQSSYTLDVLFILIPIIIVGSSAYSIFGKNYIPSTRWFAFYVFCVLEFWLFRFWLDVKYFNFLVFEFNPFGKTWGLTYLGLLFIILGLGYLMIFIVKRIDAIQINKDKELIIEKSELYPEDYLQSTDILEEKHPLNRLIVNVASNMNYVESLCKKVIGVNSNNSFAVAVLGQWGAGKSLFLKQIKTHLQSNYSKNVKVFDFHPWKNKGEDAIIRDFFALLKKNMILLNGNISPQIDSYLDALLDSGKTVESRFLRMLFLESFIPKNTDDEYIKLKKIISGCKEKIVIIIDDLDRLDANEILGVLKLIRNVANFGNLVFIVAYDRVYVDKSLEKSVPDNESSNYLEKIFQIEISLPLFDPRELSEMLLLLLEYKIKNVFNSESGVLVRKVLVKNSKSIIWDYLKNVRDIIRFVNLFIIDYNCIQDENQGKNFDLSLEDFIWTRLLKLKFPKVFLLLYEKKDKLFRLEEGYLNIKSQNDNNDIIGEEFNENKYQEKDSQNILNLLYLIFRQGEKVDNKYIAEIKSFHEINQENFSNEWSFYRYFTSSKFDWIITKNDIINLINKEESEIIEQINKWIREEKCPEFKFWNLMNEINFEEHIQSKKVYEKFISALFQFRWVFNHTSYLTYAKDILFGKGWTEKYYGEEATHKIFVKKCLENTKAIPFLSSLIKSEEKVFLAENELEQILLKQLPEAHKKGEVLHSLKFCTYINKLIESKRINTKDSTFINWFKEFIKTNPKEFLTSLLIRFRSNKFEVGLREPVIEYFFGGISNLETFYKGLKLESEIYYQVFFKCLLTKWDKKDSLEKTIILYGVDVFLEEKLELPICCYEPDSGESNDDIQSNIFSICNKIWSTSFRKISIYKGLSYYGNYGDIDYEPIFMETVCLAIPKEYLTTSKINIEYSFNDLYNEEHQEDIEKFKIGESSIPYKVLNPSEMKNENVNYVFYKFDTLNGDLVVKGEI